MFNYLRARVKYAHEPVSLLRILLVCAIVFLRAPVAQPPIVRIPTHNTIIIETNATTIVHHHRTRTNRNRVQISGSNHRTMSKARVYTDINVLRPKEYWDYESLTVQWG